MQIGVHGLVFTGQFDEQGLVTAASGAQQAGFDLLELPLMNPYTFDGPLVQRIADDHNLAVTASLGLDADHDLTSDDPATRQRGRDLLHRAVDVVAEAGGAHLCGVLYSAMRKYMHPATPQGLEYSATIISELGEYARTSGVQVSLEVVNRYETNVFNTGRGALQFLQSVTSNNVAVHLDTYHMNIEESGLYQPVIDTATQLRYVHIGESHRGYLGTGTVDFGSFFRALAAINYSGPVVFESFSSAVVSEALSNTLGIWRNLWNDSADLAAHANRFIRDHIRAVDTIAMH
ncbi:sugar phosphate isomerase/epimerase family protein [Microbacterium sp. YY-01]|uniref:sugar phosphate isomerase/epimerase family protein n=1 Tax=Microbacterium sp. YY-01 TaxID=3421634 RepID=UPI003D17D90E